MEDRFEQWRDSLADDEVGEIIIARLGEEEVEYMLWEQFVENEQDRAEYEGEIQSEIERGN